MVEPGLPQRLVKAIGVLLLIGAVLRLWHFAGARSFWLDEAMVALNIVHLSPMELMGPLVFDQLAPAGWLLMEKASLLLWDNFDYSLRLPSLIGGIAALYLFYRFLDYAAEAWETVAGVAMMALFPVFIVYSAEVKPYIFDVLFSVAMLLSALALLRATGRRVGGTLLYGAIGLACIPLSFGGTLAMAGTGTTLFVAAIFRKDYAWAAMLAAVGLVWGLLFGAIYSLVYAANAETISNMTGLYWMETFAPVPASLRDLLWYSRTAAMNIDFLMSSPNAQLILVVWIYGMVRIAMREPWLVVLLVSPVIATLFASMLGQYAFDTRFLLGLAATLLFGVASGAVGIAMRFRYRAVAGLVLALLLGLSPLKETATAAVHNPPFPHSEIKITLDYLKRHFRDGDKLVMHPLAERAFAVYADRFGLADIDYKVTTKFRRDPTCVFDDVRMIQGMKQAWLLLYHIIGDDKAHLRFLERVLGQTGTLTLVSDVPGSRLYKYTARPEAAAVSLPPSAPVCSLPRTDQEFLERVLGRKGAGVSEQK